MTSKLGEEGKSNVISEVEQTQSGAGGLFLHAENYSEAYHTMLFVQIVRLPHKTGTASVLGNISTSNDEYLLTMACIYIL